ncbi:MAG TPA: RagB/SusD family nutrient uptake outer membrane protein [Longimicrobium sp.]|jgi:hypothetical protein
MIKKQRGIAVALGLLAAGACSDITVPDYRDPPLENLLNNPSVEDILKTSTGVLQGTRQDSDTYVRFTGITGREGYFLDPNEPRYVTAIYNGTPSAGNFTGSSYWTTPFRNIRTANVLIAGLDKVEMPAADEEAIRGLAKTIQAVDYLQLLNTRAKIPVQVNTSLDSLFYPAPLVERDVAFTHISNLLDEAQGHLQKAGENFPFPMPSGFSQFGFNKPAKFIQFNRALKARVEVYRATLTTTRDAARYQAALTALGQSFITTTGAVDPVTDRTLLNLGAYQTYSGNSGDTPNTLSDVSGKTVAEPKLRTDAELRANGQRDARYVAKIDSTSASSLVGGLSSNLRFAHYTTRPFYGGGGLASPIPIIRNEELILLRAEARWFTGDKVGAMADLNFIRVNSGGLQPAATPATDAAFITELLAQRRYSLLFEGGHRWIDFRRFGLRTSLPATGTPRALATPSFGNSAEYFPLPNNEANARL